jgi:hypothetical protein
MIAMELVDGSPDSAAAWATTIGYPATVFVERALQDEFMVRIMPGDDWRD